MSVVWSGMCQIFVLAMVKNSHQILVKFFFWYGLVSDFFFCEKFSSDSRQVFFVLMKFLSVFQVKNTRVNTCTRVKNPRTRTQFFWGGTRTRAKLNTHTRIRAK